MADTYSYRSGFRVFAENSTTNVTSDYNGIYRNDTTWENYDARKSGLLPGDFISSITLNTALRQATFMSTLLGEALAGSGITGQTIDTSSVSNLTSWVDPVSRAIAYGYNLSTNNIKIGGNFNGTFTAQFGPDILNATGDVIPVPVGCYRFTGYQNLTANTLMSVKPTNDGNLKFTENDPTDARGDLYAATLHAQYGDLRVHPGLLNYDTNLNSRIATMQEVANAAWLSGGILIQSGTDLNTLTTVGNYYYPSDGKNIVNVPLGASGRPFTLKVSSVHINNESYIQQQFTLGDNGTIYTRVRKTDGNWESVGSALGSYGSGWSVTYNTITAAIIDFTRDEALNSGCEESKDGKHKIMVPVKALIQCAVNHYSTRACLRVGGVGGTLETNPSYFGIQIEGLPAAMDDFLVHIDMKTYNSDTWITLEQTTKTYQCFYNSNYYSPTINGEPNPNYNAKPIWIYVPRAGDRTQVSTGGAIPDAPTGNIGSASQPVYLTDGVLTPCTYATVVDSSLPDKPDANTLYFITEN